MSGPSILLPDETCLSTEEYQSIKHKIISYLAENDLTACSAKAILSELLDEIDNYAKLKIPGLRN